MAAVRPASAGSVCRSPVADQFASNGRQSSARLAPLSPPRPPPTPAGERSSAGGHARHAPSHTRAFRPVIATGSSTSAICASRQQALLLATSSRMPRPVRIASAASSVERS